MNVDSVNTSPGAATVDRQAMGKEQFLELLVAQLGHQDPLNPLDDKEFIAQLAQFSSLEQMMAVNENLTLLQMSQSAIANAQFTTLIGTEVTASNDTLALTGGDTPDLVFDLDASAQSVTLKVVDEYGNVVRTIDHGAMGAGQQTITWDGCDDDGRPLADGTYRIEIEASDATGGAVGATAAITGVVTGVTFENGYPELLIGETRVRPADVTRIANNQSEPQP